MIFKVKRLHDATDAGRRYHLFDEAHHLLLVADQGSPWLPEEPGGRVRFARPGGEQVATLDLPRVGSASAPPGKKVSYAIIFNHAVYAIFNEQSADPNSPPDYLLEVEGSRWFVTREEPDRPASLNIYNQSPTDAEFYPETELPGPIGTIRPAADGVGDYDFTISLPEERLSQAALIALALVVIADGRPSK
jgi:hypothetical protein